MNRKIWTRGLNGLLVVLCLGYLLWPYGTVLTLRSALKSADEAAVAGWVDWPALKSGLRDDLKKIMISSVNESLKAQKSDAQIRLSFGSASIVDQLADVLASPRGLILLFNDPKALACVLKSRHGLKPKNKPSKQSAACSALLTAKSLPKPARQDFGFQGPNVRRLWQKINYAFFTDPFTFEFDVRHENVRVVLIFERVGWGWKLTRLSIPDIMINREMKSRSQKPTRKNQ